MINSRTKGAAGEREAAEFLRRFGWNARRGQQFSGSPDSPDVVSDFPFHLEIKRVQASSPMKWIEKATEDCGEEQQPCVLWRPNRKPWMAMFWAEDLLNHLNRKTSMKNDPITLSREDYAESLKQAEEAGYRRGIAMYDSQRAVASFSDKVSTHPVIMDDVDAVKADFAVQQSGC